MNPLLLSTSDIEGGAARAAYRLHTGLKSIGINSKMLVRAKGSKDKTVITQSHWLTKLGPTLSNWSLRNYTQREKTLFSTQWNPDVISYSINKLNPDIVNLHWVCTGYLKIETLKKIGKPLVWTLQDMWAFTGGCHYSQDCDLYQQSCGMCPQLKSQREHDLSRKTWHRKSKAWQGLNLTIVTPSQWMAKCVKASSLFKDLRVETIPFCLDTKIYQPHDPIVARQILNLPTDKQIIIFGALAATADKRKGFDLLISCLNKLNQSELKEGVEVAIFGSSKPENPIDIGFKIHYLGHFNDDISLSLAYSAASVMVVPSIQESFGQTASEALACGTPVVAFNATGLKDIVDHKHNGYLAKPYCSEDLARGIAWILEDRDRHNTLEGNAREKALKHYPLERQAKLYSSLFEEILQASTS